MSEQRPPEPAVPEADITLLAVRRIQDEVREQVRLEAWATMRRQFRIAVAGLGLVCLLVGALLGHYGGGRRSAARGATTDDAPVWGCVTPSPGDDGAALSAQPTPWPIRVYVSGAVPEARVVELPPGSLIGDALEKLGGASSDADLAALNLAEPLRDHQHVQVPRLSSRAAPVTPTAPGGSGAVDAPGSRLNINTATPADLETLPGIGPTRAEAIVAYREAHGTFETVDELMDVPGIGPATYEGLAPFITVDPPPPAP